MTMDISVIIPVYNVEPYVAECIKSVMAQKNVEDVNVECLIVDDCGTDNSMEVVRETLRDYSGSIDFRIITREANGGLSAARNSGIREAKGEYLYFLDSDDLITPDCLSTFWKQVQLHPGAEMIYGQYINFYEDGKTEQTKFLKDLGIADYSETVQKFRKVYFKITTSVWNRLISRRWLSNNDLFFTEGLLYEDLDWDIKTYYHIRNYALNSQAEPTYYYRQRSNSIMSSYDKIQRFKYLSNLLYSAYENLPYWDINLTGYLVWFLYDFRNLLSSTEKPEYNKYYYPILNKLFKSDKSRMPHRILFAYLYLGQPWLRFSLCKWLCSLIKTPKL